MLSLVVVAIMLGFPTAFTLMGMGVLFAWLAYRADAPQLATQQTLDLMVQRTYSVMSNDVLIAVPLFVFMGYLVERAALIERLFKSLHLAMSFIPGSLAVATLATCAIFSTATGIVGAVVTLMGLLAFPATTSGSRPGRSRRGAASASSSRPRSSSSSTARRPASRSCSSTPAPSSPASCSPRSTSAG
jgi:TRAP-type mannitol/chloroaromatic compound transport system permease large subunit